MITFIVTVAELGNPLDDDQEREEPSVARARLRKSFAGAIVQATNELQRENPALRIVEGAMVPAIVQQALKGCTGAREIVVVDSRAL